MLPTFAGYWLPHFSEIAFTEWQRAFPKSRGSRFPILSGRVGRLDDGRYTVADLLIPDVDVPLRKGSRVTLKFVSGRIVRDEPAMEAR